MDDPAPRPLPFKRFLLKLSGGFLGEVDQVLDRTRLDFIASQLRPVLDAGVGVGIVTGGGNILRGAVNTRLGMPRTTLDRMGMLATLLNGVAISEALNAAGIPSASFSAFPIGLEGIRPFTTRDAVALLADGGVPVFTGGTGLPYFSTDTASVVRALQIGADLMVKGSRVDGVYDKDPERHADAQRFDRISYQEVLARGLAVMDQAAFVMARQNRLPLVVLDIGTPGILGALLEGTARCTRVAPEREGGEP
ncbi:MAG: UMP kinase [Pseudomonadota bacterium]